MKQTDKQAVDWSHIPVDTGDDTGKGWDMVKFVIELAVYTLIIGWIIH